MEEYLQQYKCKEGESGNLFSFTGKPSPGKWNIPDSDYKKFTNLTWAYKNAEYTFAETWATTKTKIAFDIDKEFLPGELQTDLIPSEVRTDQTYEKWREIPQIQKFEEQIIEMISFVFSQCSFTLNINLVDVDTTCVKGAPPRTKKDKIITSYHVLINALSCDVTDMPTFVKTILEPKFPNMGIDIAIYQNGPFGGLRATWSGKNKNDRVTRPIFSVQTFYDNASWFSMRIQSNDFDRSNWSVHYPSSCHGFLPPVYFPEKFFPDEAESEDERYSLTQISEHRVNDEPEESSPNLDKLIKSIAQTLKTEITKVKHIDNGVQLSYKSNWCDIARRSHERSDGKVVTVGRTGATITCLHTNCLGKKFKLANVDLKLLKELFPAPQKKRKEPSDKSPDAKESKRSKEKPPAPLEILCQHIWKCLGRDKLFKYESSCYEHVLNTNGIPTGYYRLLCSLEEYIHQNTHNERHPNLWEIRIHDKGCVSAAVKEITMTKNHSQFPDLERSQNAWSYNNGQLIGDQFRFEYHDPEKMHRFVSSKFFSCDVPEELIKALNDKTLDVYEAFCTYCPKLKSIYDYQGWSKEELEIWLALQGRVYYPAKSDNLQCAPMLIGPGGTGKSTIAESFLATKETGDYAALDGASHEVKFGLQPIYSKHLHVCTELSSIWSLPQTQFQMMVSGNDPMTLAKKNGNPIHIPFWNNRGFYCGNKQPIMDDAEGQISRRVIQFKFHKKITNVDTNLGYNIIRNETPFLPLILVAAYQRLLCRSQDGVDIWMLVPDKLKIQREVSMENRSSLHAFFNSDEVHISKIPKDQDPFKCSVYVPDSVLSDAYRKYCISNSLKPVPWKQDNLEGAFSDFGLVKNIRKQGLFQTEKDNGKIFIPKDLRRLYPRFPASITGSKIVVIASSGDNNLP